MRDLRTPVHDAPLHAEMDELTPPPSVLWWGWGHRTVSEAEARRLARGEDVEFVRDPERAGSLNPWPMQIAGRLRRFIEQHPELSESARLDLCCLLPFEPSAFPGEVDDEVTIQEPVQLDGEVITPELEAEGLERPASGHPEFSVVGLDNLTVKLPIGGRKAVGGDAALAAQTARPEGAAA